MGMRGHIIQDYFYDKKYHDIIIFKVVIAGIDKTVPQPSRLTNTETVALSSKLLLLLLMYYL